MNPDSGIPKFLAYISIYSRLCLSGHVILVIPDIWSESEEVYKMFLSSLSGVRSQMFQPWILISTLIIMFT